MNFTLYSGWSLFIGPYGFQKKDNYYVACLQCAVIKIFLAYHIKKSREISPLKLAHIQIPEATVYTSASAASPVVFKKATITRVSILGICEGINVIKTQSKSVLLGSTSEKHTPDSPWPINV